MPVFRLAALGALVVLAAPGCGEDDPNLTVGQISEPSTSGGTSGAAGSGGEAPGGSGGEGGSAGDSGEGGSAGDSGEGGSAGDSGEGGSAGSPITGCGPGRFAGSYAFECYPLETLPVASGGELSFELVGADGGASGSNCQEFCGGLVIKQGTGRLFGTWGGVAAFEGWLAGGLDCGSGVFRADVTDGVWGFPVNAVPGNPATEVTGVFPTDPLEATLMGRYEAGPPQKIEGEWFMIPGPNANRCLGTFTFERQP
jgi:hypothetical protein